MQVSRERSIITLVCLCVFISLFCQKRSARSPEGRGGSGRVDGRPGTSIYARVGLSPSRATAASGSKHMQLPSLSANESKEIEKTGLISCRWREEVEMVGVAEEAELDRLELQVEGGSGDGAQYLALARKLKVRRSEKVSQIGLALLNNPSAVSKLGDEVWNVYEQVAIASMDCNGVKASKDCVTVLMRKFPESQRISRLEGMWLESTSRWRQAEALYEDMIKKNPSDPHPYKRSVAIAKAEGKISGAMEALNKYLELFMADHDAWRELAELYISLLMYKQAAFCYEELILAQPTNALYHLGYAEVLYTLGGLDNMRSAKKYYAATLELSGGRNVRALYGIVLCGTAINQVVKGARGRDEKDFSELVSLAGAVLSKEYKRKAPKKLPFVKSLLERPGVSS